jgi:hypothetical protein
MGAAVARFLPDQGLLWIGLAIVVIWALLSLAFYLIRETLKAFREAKNIGEVGAVLFGVALCCIGLPMLAYAGWLWLDGVQHPMKAALESGIGDAWMVVMLLFAAGAALAGLLHAWKWASRHRAELRPIIVYRLRVFFRGYLEFLGGPVTFPIREWRIRSEAGAGAGVKVLSTVYVSVVGLVVAVITATLTFTAVYGALSWLGVVE